MKARVRSQKLPKSGEAAVSKIPAEELKRFLELRHPDPHSILGAHPTDHGGIVRAFRPDAQQMFLMVDGEPPREMVKRPEPGLFETLVSERREFFPYQLAVHYPGGLVETIRQPYAFSPTLGE